MELKSLSEEEMQQFRKPKMTDILEPYVKVLESFGNVVIVDDPTRIMRNLKTKYDKTGRKLHVGHLPDGRMVVYLGERWPEIPHLDLHGDIDY